MSRRAVLIGVGAEHRGDDVAGLVAVRCAAPLVAGATVVECDGESGHLIEAWTGADVAIVVDAVRTGAPAGTIHRVDDPAGLPNGGVVGSHALGIGDAVALGRALDRMPRRLVFFGIEGEVFTTGAEPQDVVTDAAHEVAARIVAELVRVA